MQVLNGHVTNIQCPLHVIQVSCLVCQQSLKLSAVIIQVNIATCAVMWFKLLGIVCPAFPLK